jgi:hypothetical protein
MINFRKYSEKSACFILQRDLDPELFPAHLYGSVKCGILEPGKELVRLCQDFPPKRRFFGDLEEFNWFGSLNNGIWVYFKDKKKMDDFLNSHIPYTVEEYNKLQGAVPFSLLKIRALMP